MNTIEFNVYPTIKHTTIICKAKVEVQSYVLFKSATLCVSLFDSTDNVISVRLFTMDGDAFASWSNDDSYVISWVKKQLMLESQVSVV